MPSVPKSKQELRKEIGKAIFKRIPRQHRVSPDAMHHFLRTQRGYSIIFDALRRIVGNIYLPQSQLPNTIDVIDVHTHIVSEDDPPCRRRYFEMGGEWWFAANRFDVGNDGETATPRCKLDNGRNIYERDEFKLANFKSAVFPAPEAKLQHQTKRIIITSAPPGSADGWMISVDEILDCCANLNKGQSLERAAPAGRLLIRGVAKTWELDPSPATQLGAAQKMKYWKLYSGETPPWSTAGGDVGWLIHRDGAGSLACIRDTSGISKTICIHWSEGHDRVMPGPLVRNSSEVQPSPCDPPDAPEPPSGTGVHSSVNELNTLLKKAAWKDLRFVIFHAAYPEHKQLAVMTNNHHRNLYIEIGTIFAGLATQFHTPRDIQTFVSTLWSFARPGSVLWGTDSAWFGAPQWQIEAFKRLQLIDLTRGRKKQSETDFKEGVLFKNAKELFFA